MDSILEARDQVERYTHTLSLALLLRQNASSEIIIAQLNQIQGDLWKARQQTGRPIKWLNPIQQYVEASASVISTANSSSSSSKGTPNSCSTLVNRNLSRESTNSGESQIDADAVNSFGTFGEWLESFMPPDIEINNSCVQDRISRSTMSESLAGSRCEPSSPQPVEIRVTDLPKQDSADGQTSALTIHLEQSDFWDQALKLLKQKGYRKICGFKLGGVLVDPLRPHPADVNLSVTEGPSVYSMAKCLKINVDEPLQLYYDNFMRMGETGSSIPPLNLNYSSNTGKVFVVDFAGHSCQNLEIAFNRTLRVPENGTIYDPPALFSPFPLIRTEDLGPSLDPQLRKKGGLVVPLYQREALALSFVGASPSFLHEKVSADFAIKIYTGSVNIVTGATHQQEENNAQNYVIVPVQPRLDGFLVRAGVVKQFVSMPLGSEYTAEGQVTGRELIGGLQMLIAPRFRARGTFRGYSNQRWTPREIGLPPGDTLLMSGAAVESRAKEFRLAAADTYLTAEGAIFHRSTEGRPVFVHEVLAQYSAPAIPIAHLSVQAVLPYNIEIQIRTPEEYTSTAYLPYLTSRGRQGLRSVPCKIVQLPREYSPFLGVNDFAKLIAELLEVEEVVMFLNDGRDIKRPPTYQALHEVIANGSVLTCQGYVLEPLIGFSRHLVPGKQIHPKKELRWDMGLVPGGGIRQEIVPDPDPLEWNWTRARLVNIQLLNSVIFKSMTGIHPPSPPISYTDYINARLPFFHTIGVGAVAETSTLRSLKSVGEQDHTVDISSQVTMSNEHKVNGCVICEKNFADSVLKPCKHIFCGLCIRDTMQEGDIIRCAACMRRVDGVVHFSAPMELPSVVTKSSKSEDDIIMFGVKDTDTDQMITDTEGTTMTLLRTLPFRGATNISPESGSMLASNHSVNEPVVYQNGRSAIQSAAASGDSNLLAQLIKAGFDVDEAPCAVGGRSALQAAAEGGHYDVVLQLLSAGANPNGPVCPLRGLSALEAAVEKGNIAIVAHLLSHGAMTISDSRRKSALHLAAENGNEAIVALLLAYGFDPNIIVDLRMQGLKPNEIFEWKQQDLDVTPSRLAAENGHLSVLKVLRVHGAKEKPISAACAHGHVEVVSWFLDCEVEKKATQTVFSPQNLEERSPYEEPTNNLYDRLQRSMRKGVDEHGYEYRGGVEGMLDKIVTTAVKHGQLEMLKMLVSRGAWLRTPKPRAQNLVEDGETFRGSTILHDAAKMGHGDVVEYLLSAGFDVNETRVFKNRTPLMEAARGGKYKGFKLLIEHGADIGAQDRDGRSIITDAAEGGSVEITSLLIHLGIDPTITSTNLVSTLSTAIQHEQRPLAEFLLEKLTTFDAGIDHCYGGALRRAACHGYVDVVQELLRRGADPNLGTPSTSLSWLGTIVEPGTNEADCIECAQALLAAGGKLHGVDGVLRHLDRAEKPALAAFLLENCLDDSNTAGTHWLEHIEKAMKRLQPKLLRLLISQFCLVQDPEQDSFAFCDIVTKAADAGQFEIVDILLQATSPQDASTYARAAISALGLRKQDHMRQYLEDRYLVVVESGWENWLGSL